MTSWTLLTLTVLADDTPRNVGPDFGKASPFGLLVIVLLLIGTFTLVWSMNRHLTKLPASFEDEQESPAGAAGETTTDEPDPDGKPAA